jgi:fatty-acyl-CoA synthase
VNTGGEKVFVEEVEQALLRHPDVVDVLVVGRPSDRFGHEVVAVVQLAEGAGAEADDIVAEAARHIARYKLPKDVVFCERVQRSPSGKADYRWATAQAIGVDA